MHESIEIIPAQSKLATGKSFASFGEVIQGRKSNGTDFLVTLPIDLWSECKVKISRRNAPVAVTSYFEKSKKAALQALDQFGITTGYQLNLHFERSIPIGKGLSSSTADMLATLRALEQAFGFSLSPLNISNIFKKIEPHDGVMYNNSVAYNHRQGKLLKDLGHIPDFKLVVLDFGGHVDSISYNHSLQFSDKITKKYDKLYQKCIDAYLEKNDRLIAKCATKSLKLDLKTNPHPLREELLKRYKEYGALGLINTHSGTCVGLIYPRHIDNQTLSMLQYDLENQYDSDSYITQTLNIRSNNPWTIDA